MHFGLGDARKALVGEGEITVRVRFPDRADAEYQGVPAVNTFVTLHRNGTFTAKKAQKRAEKSSRDTLRENRRS